MRAQQEPARYDLITEFYLGVVATNASDPSAATLLAMLVQGD